jgi:CelD/BcsL family acetyltransferase involved in cellulose biosynthesis
MNTRVITSVEEFLSLKGVWNALLKGSSNDLAHLSHEWMKVWWQSFGENSGIHIILVYDAGGEVVGIAPLMSLKGRYRGFSVKKISLMVNGHSPSGDIIAKRGCMEEVTEAVFKTLAACPDWEMIELPKIDSKGPTYEAILNHLSEGTLHFGIKNNIETPYVPIDTTWDEFIRKRGKRFKKSLRNKLNRAERAGGVTVESVPLTSSENGVFVDILKISKESWKSRIKADMNANMNYRGFYKGITDIFGKEGLINVWLLKKSGEPIAFEFHLTYDGVVYPMRADYSRSFKDLSPGSVLEYNILKSIFNGSSVREYNTCGHSYHYLMNWTERTRKYKNIEIFRGGLRPHLLFVLEYGLIPVARKVKPGFIDEVIKDHREKLK